jgi:hypothetical protein
MTERSAHLTNAVISVLLVLMLAVLGWSIGSTLVAMFG